MKNITLLLIALILSTISISQAETEITEGYDENTEITIKGTIVEVIHGIKGPVILKMRTGIKVYNVVTAPRWYLVRSAIVFDKDIPLEVTGSRYFAADGNLYIIARHLKNLRTGQTIFFRDSFCRPLWGRHGIPKGYRP